MFRKKQLRLSDDEVLRRWLLLDLESRLERVIGAVEVGKYRDPCRNTDIEAIAMVQADHGQYPAKDVLEQCGPAALICVVQLLKSRLGVSAREAATKLLAQEPTDGSANLKEQGQVAARILREQQEVSRMLHEKG